VALVTAALVIGGCDDGADVESAEGDPRTVVELAEEQDFEDLVAGQPFEGTAVVTEVLSPHGFTLFDTLVVTRDDAELRVDERVRVRGTVRRATIAEVEAELGIDLSEAVAAAHDGGLLIVADEVRRVEFPDPLD
jgi:hypothetical protein